MEAVNSAESIIHDTDSKMEEFKDQLPADEVRGQTLLTPGRSKVTGFGWDVVFQESVELELL